MSSDLKYSALIGKLKNDVKELKSDEEKVKIYIEFLENYMMPKEYWLDLLKLSNKQNEHNLTYTIHPIFLKLLKMSPYYFMYTAAGSIKEGYHLKIYEDINGMYTKIDSSSISIIEEYLQKHKIDLMLPHKELKQFLICYERDLFSPLSSDFINYVEKMAKLFLKIKSAEGDSEMWFKYLKEVNDPEYIKQNVENFLLRNLSNIKLWKIYIEYLRESDPKEMLQVLSKYCRCFLDDFEMKEKYKNEVKIYGPVFVKWKNPFDFEDAGERCVTPDPREFLNFAEKRKRKEKNEVFICPKVELTLIYAQDWSLPKPLIRYIASQPYPPTSEKLLQTCKYFLKLNSLLYCYKAAFVYTNMSDAYEIKENSFLISIPSLNTPPFDKKNIYITNILIFHDSYRFFINKQCSTKLSAAIKNNIYQCNAKFIDIVNQNLSEEEFKFLVGHGNVKYLKFDDIHVFENVDNREEMSVEEILKMTPKLQYACIDNHNLKISNTFSKLEFTQKIIYFSIKYSSSVINSNEYCTFLKKYAAPFSRFYASHEFSIDENLRNDFDETVKSFVQRWHPSHEKPRISLRDG